jgi:hypothetical protein
MLTVNSRSVPKSDEKLVFLKTKASIPLIANILSNTKAKEIHCSRAIYKTIPPRALAALLEMGVKVKVASLFRGRPVKHSKKTRSRVIALLASGLPKKEVSRRLKIPLRTVYWIGKT